MANEEDDDAEAVDYRQRRADLRTERDEHILRLAGAGYGDREIARMVGEDHATVGRVRRNQQADERAALRASRTGTPVEQLRSGSLPQGAQVEEQVDGAAVADLVMKRHRGW